MTKEEMQLTVLPGDTVIVNSDDWFSNGTCTIKEIQFDPKSTQVRIKTTDGHQINTAWHFVEKIRERK